MTYYLLRIENKNVRHRPIVRVDHEPRVTMYPVLFTQSKTNTYIYIYMHT